MKSSLEKVKENEREAKGEKERQSWSKKITEHSQKTTTYYTVIGDDKEYKVALIDYGVSKPISFEITAVLSNKERSKVIKVVLDKYEKKKK